ncbi:MAG: mercury resistance system periplasmic binding protein MerP [Methylocystis sp.]|nr:mercury resistance system periplasmic binding protein MerP [Methylocystis sp.]
MKKLAAVVAFAVAFTVPAFAATQTVALSVSNMTCAACPITVKKALTNVPGVQSAEVSYEKKEAVVTYDDAKTSVEALIEATEGAGYPSQVKK